LQIDAVNDPDHHQDLIRLGGSYPGRLSASGTVQGTFAEIVQIICDRQFGEKLISIGRAQFIDGEAYYPSANYFWVSGAIFKEAAGMSVRGVLKCRYYGNSYILAAYTAADEGGIQNYSGIATNILDSVSFGDGWTTPGTAKDSTSWFDSGDYGNSFTL
jgi:hypothetical protein